MRKFLLVFSAIDVHFSINHLCSNTWPCVNYKDRVRAGTCMYICIYTNTYTYESDRFIFCSRSQTCENWLLASSCLSVHPSLWNNLAPTGPIFTKFNIWAVFRKSLEKKFRENLTRITDTLHEDQCTYMYMTISRWILIWCDIYLLTAIRLSPGGRISYTFTHKQYIEGYKTNNT